MEMTKYRFREGYYPTRLRDIWNSMHNRCKNIKSASYPRYGGRGIKVCDEWSDKNTGFYNFVNWSLENGYAEQLSIDRIDNDGPYAPWNCRWATPKEQANNTAKNVRITYNGKTHTASEWAGITGIKRKTILKRYHSGKSLDEVFKPVQKEKRYNINGKEYTIHELSKLTGIKVRTLRFRIKNGKFDNIMEPAGSNRITDVNITYEGLTFNVADWAKLTGLPRDTLYSRIYNKLPTSEVLLRKSGELKYKPKNIKPLNTYKFPNSNYAKDGQYYDSDGFIKLIPKRKKG